MELWDIEDIVAAQHASRLPSHEHMVECFTADYKIEANGSMPESTKLFMRHACPLPEDMKRLIWHEVRRQLFESTSRYGTITVFRTGLHKRHDYFNLTRADLLADEHLFVLASAHTPSVLTVYTLSSRDLTTLMYSKRLSSWTGTSERSLRRFFIRFSSDAHLKRALSKYPSYTIS